MPDLIDQLSKFNRKERFFLIGHALDNRWFSLSENFRRRLGDKLGIEIPSDAFAGMDYHLDCIAACLRVYQEPERDVFPNSGDAKEVVGTQQDIDFLIAFKAEERYHIVLLEAKGYGSWSNAQLSAKARRLKQFFGQDGCRYSMVTPHFCLMSPKESSRLETGRWPAWMKKDDTVQPHWLKLELPPNRRRVTLCDSEGASTIDGDYFTIVPA